MRDLPTATPKNFVSRYPDHNFDYGGVVDRELADQMAKDAEVILRAQRRMISDIIEMGKILNRYKAESSGLAPGTFGCWRDSLGISERMAQHFINVALRAPEIKAAQQGESLLITLGALYDLSAKSNTPERVKVGLKMAKDKAGSGEGGTVTRKDIQKLTRPKKDPEIRSKQIYLEKVVDDNGWDIVLGEPFNEKVNRTVGAIRELLEIINEDTNALTEPLQTAERMLVAFLDSQDAKEYTR